MLRDQIANRDKRIKELETQSPDALLNSLSKSIEVSLAEIARLNADKEIHASEISEKQRELSALQERLKALSTLISESDLLCPLCGAPLMHRYSRPIYGHAGGREVQTDVECSEYQCGYATEDFHEVTPCPNRPKV